MSLIRTLYHRYLSLRLPWRRHILIGHDLAGNSFWEYHPSGLSSSSSPASPATRAGRRILRPRRGRKTHLGEVTVSPAWHQWLKRTRAEPPSIEEQVADVERLKVLQVNARLADERWKGKARYIEKPRKDPEQLMEGGGSEGLRRGGVSGGGRGGVGNTGPTAVGSSSPSPAAATEQDPWKKAAQEDQETGSNPGSKWQPEAWEPSKKKS